MAYLSSNHPYYLNQMLQPPSQQGGGGAEFLQQQQQAAKGNDAMMDDDASGAMEEDSKHEQLLPIDYMPCPNTVIVGRGKKVAQHAGNVRFREYVKQELEEYSAATTKAHKSSIIIRVLTQVREKSPYAFVKQNLSTGRWYRVEETSQRITTAQAFRDALKDNYKSSRAFKKLKREEEKKMNNGEEGEGGEKKEKKRKKRASKTNTAPSPTEEAETTASPSASPPAVTPPASVVASAASALGGGAAAAAAEDMAKKAKVDEKAMADLRSVLDDAQNALLSGNIRLWNADTNIAQLKQAPGSAAAAAAAAKAPLAASLAPGSAAAAAAANRAALDRNFNWSFNSNLNLSGHSMLSLSRHSNKSLGLGLDHSFSNPHGAAGNTSTGSGLSAAAAELMFSNHSNLSLSRHSNFSNLGSLHRPGAAAAAAAAANPWNLSGHSTMSNLSGHSTGTFTGLVRQFGGQVDPTANPFDPRPMPGSVAAAAAYAKERAELAAAHPWLALSGATAESAPAAALAAAAREDAMDVEMDDATAPAATASSLAAAAAARKQAAGSAAAVLNRHITQDEATALEAIGNLSDHSFMSNMSSLHSAKYSPDEIFDHKMGEAAARRNRHHHHHHHPRDPHGHLHQNPYQGHHLP